jgi:Zn-dependent membrane protease YugP
MYFFDPTYFIVVLPAIIFAFYAQARVSSTVAQASRVRGDAESGHGG